MAGRIFLNYRRADDPGHARALYRELADAFSKDDLFMDVEGALAPGDDFVEVLGAQVAACEVLLVIIGLRWETLIERPSDSAKDFVEIEIAAALEHRKRVVPVLVGGAAMPAEKRLPESIRKLARLHAASLRPDRFTADCQALIAGLRRTLDTLAERRAILALAGAAAGPNTQLEARAYAADSVPATKPRHPGAPMSNANVRHRLPSSAPDIDTHRESAKSQVVERAYVTAVDALRAARSLAQGRIGRAAVAILSVAAVGAASTALLMRLPALSRPTSDIENTVQIPLTSASAATAPQPTAASDTDAPVRPQQQVGAIGDTGVRTRTPGHSKNDATTLRTELTDEDRALLRRMGGATEPPDGNQASTMHPVAETGGLTAEQLSQVVLNGRKNLQRCYEAALRGTSTNETVRMDVDVQVSPYGNVTSVRTSGKGLPGMDDCIVHTIQQWRFPMAAEITQTRFPVLFQPGG